MAGINAGLRVKGAEPLTLDRTQAYIGILIDDLVTKGTDEPYRMFTSRAEFRLHLRIDNADLRLMPIGHRVGLIGEEHFKQFKEKYERVRLVKEFFEQCRPNPSTPAGEALYCRLSQPPADRPALSQLLKRPEISIDDCEPLLRDSLPFVPTRTELEIAAIDIKYGGYLAQQLQQMARLKKAESRRIPQGFEYKGIPGLSREMVEKLTRVRPRTLGQASRIPGVTPAAISILNVYVEMGGRRQVSAQA